MKTQIYLSKVVTLSIGYDLKEGVVADLITQIPPCTLFVDTHTGEIVIDFCHTPPVGWLEEFPR